jgi:hypothetical protein
LFLEGHGHAGSVGDAGSVSALRSRGVTHVVVASLNFDRYFDPNNILLTTEAQKIREFRAELFASSAPLVVFKASPLSEFFASPDLLSELFVSPELRVYELSPEGLHQRPANRQTAERAVTAG